MSSAARESVTDYSLKRTSGRIGSLLRGQDTTDGSHLPTAGGENPFIWDFTKLFGTHPTELWGEQRLLLTTEGSGHLANPEDIPQFILLSRSVGREDLRKFLFLVNRGYDVGGCLKRGVEPVIMSLALKNGLITLVEG